MAGRGKRCATQRDHGFIMIWLRGACFIWVSQYFNKLPDAPLARHMWWKVNELQRTTNDTPFSPHAMHFSSNLNISLLPKFFFPIYLVNSTPGDDTLLMLLQFAKSPSLACQHTSAHHPLSVAVLPLPQLSPETCNRIDSLHPPGSCQLESVHTDDHGSQRLEIPSRWWGLPQPSIQSIRWHCSC